LPRPTGFAVPLTVPSSLLIAATCPPTEDPIVKNPGAYGPIGRVAAASTCPVETFVTTKSALAASLLHPHGASQGTWKSMRPADTPTLNSGAGIPLTVT